MIKMRAADDFDEIRKRMVEITRSPIIGIPTAEYPDALACAAYGHLPDRDLMGNCPRCGMK